MSSFFLRDKIVAPPELPRHVTTCSRFHCPYAPLPGHKTCSKCTNGGESPVSALEFEKNLLKFNKNLAQFVERVCYRITLPSDRLDAVHLLRNMEHELGMKIYLCLEDLVPLLPSNGYSSNRFGIGSHPAVDYLIQNHLVDYWNLLRYDGIDLSIACYNRGTTNPYLARSELLERCDAILKHDAKGEVRALYKRMVLNK